MNEWEDLREALGEALSDKHVTLAEMTTNAQKMALAFPGCEDQKKARLFLIESQARVDTNKGRWLK